MEFVYRLLHLWGAHLLSLGVLFLSRVVFILKNFMYSGEVDMAAPCLTGNYDCTCISKTQQINCLHHYLYSNNIVSTVAKRLLKRVLMFILFTNKLAAPLRSAASGACGAYNIS